MALSNWDVLAVDEHGTPTNGVLKTADGVTVHFYKNWLYIDDPASWRKGAFTTPCVSQVWHGAMDYRGVSIMAERGPQEGVYAAVIYPTYGPLYHVMVGIGCYGFADTTRLVLSDLGREAEISDDWFSGSEFTAGSSTHTTFVENTVTRERLVYTDPKYEAWLGVQPSSVEHLRGLLRSWSSDHEVLGTIDLSRAVRFNAGDAFLSRPQDFSSVATPPGRAKTTTILTDVIRGMSKTDDKEGAPDAV